jgi:hypothetical protein
MPNNYILLETIALTQSAASVTFDNLPTSGYTDLKVVISARGDSTSGFPETVNLRFNGSSASEYSWRGLFSVTATPGSNSDTSVTLIRAGSIPSVAQTANTFSNTEIYIPNYRSSNNKSVSIDATSESNSTTDFNYALIMNAGIRANTAAITAINLSLAAGNFVANSTFSLYGIAAFGTTPVLAPKATGGNIIANDGTFWYHAFTSSGFFAPQTNLTADVLVIAGGGAGGIGGGGAGGVAYYASQALTTISLSCTVGAGGAAQSNNVTAASKGVNSVFGSLAAAIGGGAGDLNDNAFVSSGFVNGGSGGGGGGSGTITTTGGTGTTGQGNRGFGNGGNVGANFPGGGGGGAGAAGSAAPNTNTGGAGGAGTSTYSSWGNATLTGQNVSGTRWYAGGGGGGGNGVTNFGAGGNGGGGNASNVPVAAGVANTGGGGGGYNGGVNAGGNGGSGIIIVRYPIA